MAQKILVVDDEPANLLLYTKLLRSEGYDVKEAEDGKTALDLVQKEQPDLIVLDYRLPDLDGLEICKRIRADLKIKQPQIVMCTAEIRALDRVQSLLAGANDFLTKPFSPIELVARVAALLYRPIRK